MKETELMVKYLEKHQKVTDLLFTGGDPMTMSYKIFRKLVARSRIELLFSD